MVDFIGTVGNHVGDRYVQRVLSACSLGVFCLLYAVYLSDQFLYLFGAATDFLTDKKSSDRFDCRYCGKFLRVVQFIFKHSSNKQIDFMELL